MTSCYPNAIRLIKLIVVSHVYYAALDVAWYAKRLNVRTYLDLEEVRIKPRQGLIGARKLYSYYVYTRIWCSNEFRYLGKKVDI